MNRRIGAAGTDCEKPGFFVRQTIQHFLLVPPETEVRIYFGTAGDGCEGEGCEFGGTPPGTADSVPGGKQD